MGNYNVDDEIMKEMYEIALRSTLSTCFDIEDGDRKVMRDFVNEVTSQLPEPVSEAEENSHPSAEQIADDCMAALLKQFGTVQWGP